MLNIVIPMAGRGSRFENAGFNDPKPFISVGGTRMIELVIRNLTPTQPHRFIFICQSTHLDRYDCTQFLQDLAPGCKVLALQDFTQGAACTVLNAVHLIDNDTPLLIANSDQWIDINIDDFLNFADIEQTDGLIMTLPASDPKWSYVQRDQLGRVCAVVEKVVVSEEATTGIYHFRRGGDFCHHARQMILADERSQGEFYVAPVYTRLYESGARNILTYNIGESMYGLGTPEDLSAFLQKPVLSRALSGIQEPA